MIIIVLLLASAVAGILQAVMGFGAAILLMMVLPYFFDMLQAPALSSSITLGACIALAWQFRAYIRPRLVILPAILYEAASITSLQIAGSLDMDSLGVAFGVFLILIALYFLLPLPTVQVSGGAVSTAVCAMVSGASSGLFGIGGPLMALYYLSVTQDKRTYAANLQFLFSLTASINLIIRIRKGFYALSFLPLTLLGILGISAGKWLGVKILERIDMKLMQRAVYILVGISGVLTLAEHL